MAPEQLEGKEADARTDIFAFGCVLYEMATGGSVLGVEPGVFDHRDHVERTAAHLFGATDVAAGAGSRRKTCLAKDPEERWQSAADIRSESSGSPRVPRRSVAPPAAVTSRRKGRERLAWMIAAGLAILAALAVAGYLKRPPVAAEPVRFEVFPPGKGNFNSADSPVAVSPDGRQLVFGVTDERGRSFLWIRSLGSLESRRLEGTDGCYDPVWSPDGRNIAFGCRSHLQRLAVAGGPVESICEMNDGRGQTWNRDNVILFTTAGGMSPILRYPGERRHAAARDGPGQVSWRDGPLAAAVSSGRETLSVPHSELAASERRGGCRIARLQRDRSTLRNQFRRELGAARDAPLRSRSSAHGPALRHGPPEAGRRLLGRQGR